MEQAFELSELVRDIAIGNIKENFPNASHREIMRMLRDRIDSI